MVDWAPSNRAALAQQLCGLSVSGLGEPSARENCAVVLRSLMQGLRHDDTVTHLFRRHLLHANCTRTYLVPLLLHNATTFEIQHLTLCLLECLSTPEESLRPSPTPAQSGLTPEASIQLSLGLRSLKEELSQPDGARALLAPLHSILARQTRGLTESDISCVSTTLSLLRNLLHVPLSADAAELTRYRNLLWVMFAARLGSALNQIMQSDTLAVWCVPVVELLAQLYKMYASSHLHVTLQNWLHPMQSDSSEDDESNTSPPDTSADRIGGPTAGACTESPSLASEATSNADMYVAGRREPGSGRAPKRQAETATESTSSDEGRNVKRCERSRTSPPPASPSASWPGHFALETAASPQKARYRTPKPCHHHKQHRASKAKQQAQQQAHVPAVEASMEPCLRLLKVARNKAHKILALVVRDPSQLDLDTVMVDFTTQFLLAGYTHLVEALMKSLQGDTDKSHLYWIIVYFMKPSTELCISFNTLRLVVSPDLLLMLVYEALRLVGEAAKQLSDFVTAFDCQRQLHMLVNALREILSGMETIKGYAGEEHTSQILHIQQQVGSLRQFRQLLLLLIGQCRLDPASLPYLRDLVLTNHLLIATQELANKSFPLFNHIKLFAEPSILLRYTSLLKFYATNPPVLNDALFTVLHHVVGDIGRIELLFQPSVLKTFSEILSSELPLLQDWLDLIEYTIHRFIERQNKQSVRAALLSVSTSERSSQLGAARDHVDVALSQSLRRLVSPCSGRLDALVAACSQAQRETGVPVSAVWALDRLRELGLLQPSHYLELRQRLVKGEAELQSPCRPEARSTGLDLNGLDAGACRRPLDHPSVEFLIDCVRRDLGDACLEWLQEELLEACLVRGVLSPPSLGPVLPGGPLPEPTALYSQRQGVATPLVPLAEAQVRAVNSPLFLRLLSTIGVELPSAECVFPVLPLSLSAAHLFAAARKVAPLNIATLKFNSAELLGEIQAPEPVELASAKPAGAVTQMSSDDEAPLLPPPPPMAPIRTANWLAMVSRQKAALSAVVPPFSDSMHSHSACMDAEDVVMKGDDPYGPVSTDDR